MEFLPSSGYDTKVNIFSARRSGACCSLPLAALPADYSSLSAVSSHLSLSLSEHVDKLQALLSYTPSFPAPLPATSPSHPHFRAQTLELLIYTPISIHFITNHNVGSACHPTATAMPPPGTSFPQARLAFSVPRGVTDMR